MAASRDRVWRSEQEEAVDGVGAGRRSSRGRGGGEEAGRRRSTSRRADHGHNSLSDSVRRAAEIALRAGPLMMLLSFTFSLSLLNRHTTTAMQ
jgi:hypothetical protein